MKRLTLRTKIVAYVVALHAVLAGAAAYVLQRQPLLLFGVEVFFILSIYAGYRLIAAFFVPLDLIRTGAELIGERDFTSRFVEVGQPEMDTLIAVYNGMIDRLREERLAAEERHQLLSRIVSASPSGIVICDFDGRFEQVNPAAQRMLTTSMRAEMASIAPGESRLIGHDGGRRVKISRTEFRDRGFGKSFYLIDEMTEELRLSEKAAYEKLIRMMSHEVNNSVGAVTSLLDSSLRYAPQMVEADRHDFESAVTIASARMDALNRFMSGFADVVRIPPPSRVRAAIAPIVQRVTSLLAPELRSRGIAITLTLDEHVSADIDAAQLEQVLINVLRNAVESIDRNGTIDVVLTSRALTISDSGAGIAEEARDNLFTPFYTTKPSGRGLGLTIVQEVLAAHAFPFALTNRPAGGAEFRVTFDDRRD